ncbi:hypothetical protein [Leptospira yasudae]|uniref:hypothetical protein n=1 Tax=Leptospira yasudae TaxID=2202201 RepID=UPI001090E78D|nr:hypothetical protein [Leptospira yasudae]TGM95980.1 hypothetical protein EHR10_18275 [Leptospira yasudae]
MQFNYYLNESDLYMLSMFYCMDNAQAAEKMYDWNNIGKSNEAWGKGPYISAPANGKEINREQPYCLRLSNELSNLTGYQNLHQYYLLKDGKQPIGNANDFLKARTIISTLVIQNQYALLELYEFRAFQEAAKTIKLNEKIIKGYKRKPIYERFPILHNIFGTDLSEYHSNAFISLSSYRNKLAHEPNNYCVIPSVALEFYIVCQALAFYLCKMFSASYNLDIVKFRSQFWDSIIKMFDEPIDFNKVENRNWKQNL